MKGRLRGFIGGISFVVLILSSFQSTGYAECPPCDNFSNSGCRSWGSGKAKFVWASKPGGSSGISLSAGSCGEEGESGKAYIFSYVDSHNATCNGEAPCNDGYNYAGTFAVIRVSGNQEAFQNTLGGLGFTGDWCRGDWIRPANGCL